jgi:sugar phosphate isomerase/epimerase
MSSGRLSKLLPQIGYCTNVHAGTDMTTIRARLDEFAVPIANKQAHDRPLGIGLWLPNSAAQELSSSDDIQHFGRWLQDRRLLPFTMNGFPFDNFHLPVVKHRVYRPTWAEQQRLDYTVKLAKILSQLHAGTLCNLASISTLPIGWPGHDDNEQLHLAGENLRKLANELAAIESETGVRIIVAIEPEPGCLLDRCEDVIDFFSQQLADTSHRKYLGVCHDICHSAVMFEDQAYALSKYAQAGIAVGKIQVSSAIDVPLEDMNEKQRAQAINQLSGFAEDRYLHQTGCIGNDGVFRLVEDLPKWLASDPSQDDKHLRIHFHVPIFLKQFGQLRATREAIRDCVTAMRSDDAPEFTGHWEVETYAWTVMPDEMRTSGLAADIEKELDWFETNFFN